jgi:hypothetical protein
MRRALVLGVVMIALVACASTPSTPAVASGVSDGVAWEVRDVVRNAARGGWDYTMVFTERAGIPVTFEREEFGGFVGGTVARGPSSTAFTGRLGAYETLRLRTWSSVSGLGGARMIWRQFIGKDPAGRPVTVNMRFYPDNLVSEPPPRAQPAQANTPSVAPAASSTAARLQELDDLKRRGLITDEEYQATRKRILEGL